MTVTAAQGATPDFARDIRPLLSDHCFACHGPDENTRAAGLRLDTAEGLASVVSTDIAASEILTRIDSSDPDTVMPPPKFHKPLSEARRTMIRQWLEAGGSIEQHWSFVTPVKPTPPETPNSSLHPIDGFLDQQALDAGLSLAPLADKRTLLRRVALTITGLPPSPDTRDRFLADPSPEAYERLVDELLQSPHYGEHFGRHWLDLVRYADTHGLHLDNYREMWPYRDWVIQAFNKNQPFDDFITDQLAGDLRENATREQQVASGFNRLNVSTNEGGSIYDEVFARNAIDRTDAFGTVFLGLTVGCAVCHDHKFDPISAKDYYSLFAFYNSLDGSEMDGNIENHPPSLKIPSESDLEKVAENERTLADVRQTMQGEIASVDEAQREWELSIGEDHSTQSLALIPLSVSTTSGVSTSLEEDHSIRIQGEVADQDMLEIIAAIPGGSEWKAIQLNALTDQPDGRVGLSTNGNVVLSEIEVAWSSSEEIGDGATWEKASLVKAMADIEQAGSPDFVVAKAIDASIDATSGWAVAGHEQTGPRVAAFVLDSALRPAEHRWIRVRLHFASQYAKHQFRHVRLSVLDGAPSLLGDKQVQLGDWHSVGPFEIESFNAGYGRKFGSQQTAFDANETFTYESRPYRWQHRGDLRDVHVNSLAGVPERSSVTLLHRTIESTQPTSVTLMLGSDDGYVVYLNGKQAAIHRGPSSHEPLSKEYPLELKKGSNDLYIKFVSHGAPQRFSLAFRSPLIEVPGDLEALVMIPESERTNEVKALLRKYYRIVHCQHEDWLALLERERRLIKERTAIDEAIPTTLVWKELAQPREAKVLVRGQYDNPGEVVPRRTPDFLPPMPEDAPNNRLGLAMWLTQEKHPLTSRVAVNRFWQHVFGTGLVKTSEDLGSQGEVPSHPELLDWLAVDFRENDWDVKRFIKMLVMTQAFQRSAATTELDRELDPENRYLARGPRQRLDAEVLRDQTLALSGLLVDRLGGPSVKPPQPEGIWEAVGYTRSNTAKFSPDEGPEVYRRSVYTFWKRTAPPPQMSTFDAPSRESCTARRERTNTPLQALLMLNGPQYNEASKHFAKRVLRDANLGSEEQLHQELARVYEHMTGQVPTPSQLQELSVLLKDLTRYYDAHVELAEKLTGEPSGALAAWTVLVSTMFNLDATVCN